MVNKSRSVGFGDWNYPNLQANDPYVFEVMDYEGYFTRKNKTQKSVAKLKGSNRDILAKFKRSPKKHIPGSLSYLSQSTSSQINAKNIYKQNKRIQISKRTYKFFKSRSSSLSEENCVSSIEINSRHAPQEHGNTHLADIGSDKMESFTMQNIGTSSLSLRSSPINQSEINTSTPTKVVVPSKEENLFLFVPRVLPHTNDVKELIPPLTEDHNFNHSQNSQTSSQMARPFMFHINGMKKNKSSAKPLKFFKSRNGNAISDTMFRNLTGDKCCSFSCTPENSKSPGVQEHMPGDDCASISESQPRDPYSLEMEDNNYSNTQNKNVEFAAIGNRVSYLSRIHEDDKRSNEGKHVPGNNLPRSSGSQSKNPLSFERALKNKLKSKKCTETFSALPSDEDWICHQESLCDIHKEKYMPSLDIAKNISNSPSKQCFTSSKTKALNQPLLHKIITQPKEANIGKRRPHQTIIEPAEDPTVTKNIDRNLYDKRSHQIELDHLSSTLLHKGKNANIKSLQKKCSIGYFYEIKNALSAAIHRRSTAAETFHKEDKQRHDLHLMSAMIHGKMENISNKPDETNNAPDIRYLAQLNSHSDYAEKVQPKVTSITDNNEQLLSKLSPGDYMDCNKSTIVKSSTEARELYTKKTGSTSLDANYVTSSKEKKSSRMSLGKDFGSEKMSTRNENVPNYSRDDFDLLFGTDEIENCFKQITEDFHLNILSEENVTTSKASSKTPGLQELYANRTNHTNTLVHKKQRIQDKVRCKDTRGKNMVKQKANTIPKQSQRTKCSARRAVNITSKATLPSSRCKNTNVENFHKEEKEKYDLHLMSAKVLDKMENVSNKTDATNTAPVTRCLAGLNIHSNYNEKGQPKVTGITDSNELLLFRKVSPGAYVVHKRNTAVEPSREFCTRGTGTASLGANDVRSTKEVKSSRMSIGKDFSSKTKTTHNEHVSNYSRDDFDLLFGTNEMEHCYKQTTEDFHLNILSEEKVTTSKASSKTPGLQDLYASRTNHTNTLVHKKQRIKDKVKHKDIRGKKKVKQKANTIPKQSQRTKCSARRAVNITSKATLPSSRCKNTNVENFHKEEKEKYDLHLMSAKVLDKMENVSNKTDTINTAPVTRCLAGLNIYCNYNEKGQPKVTGTTDRNGLMLFSKVSPGAYKNTTVEPSTKFCTRGTSSTSFDANDVRSMKEVKSSRMSIGKDFSSETKTTHNENVSNYSRDDFDLLFGTNEMEHCIKQTTEDLHLKILSEEKVTTSKASSKAPGHRDSYANRLKSTNEFMKRMKDTVECKDTSEENLIKRQTKAIPKQRQKTPRSKCTSKQAINNITDKASLSTMKRSNRYKKPIFISNQRKGCSLLYKHKWVDDIETKEDTGLASPTRLLVQPIGITKSGHHEEELQISELVCVASEHFQSIAFTNKAEAVHLKRNELDKKHLKVLRNVRKPERIQELGELQEFNDDIEYILDTLQDSNPVAIRCHSTLILASKCFIPAFRTHVGVYEAVAKCFHALHDAVHDQSLALCTATVMYVLSFYQLNTYLNYNSTMLLLSLLNADLISGAQSIQLHSIKKKALELCCKVQNSEYATHLNLENITANLLAAEALLSLTHCDAMHLFEDALSRMEGLEHIIKAISTCKTEIDNIAIEWKEPVLGKLKFLSCCMQVLEHITDQNEEIQLEVLKYEDGDFIETIAALFAKCAGEVRNMNTSTNEDTASTITVELLLTILKILNNLTHSAKNTSFGSCLVARRPDIINTSLYMLLQTSHYMPERKKFDVLALVLMFLINAVEHNTYNRKLVFEAKVSDDTHIMEALIEFFYHQERLARIEEYKTNAMLDDKIDSAPLHESPESSQKFIDTLEEKAGHNMEYTMIASYIVLLIAYLIEDNKEYEMYVCQCLRQKRFSVMTSVLEKMYNFLNLVPSISSEQDIVQTQRVIQYLKQLDEKAAAAT